jgi:hypothetical protein
VAYPIEPNAEHLVTEMQKHVDTFFAKKYEEYRKFTERLRADSSYPYKKREASSESRLAVFNQLAFFLEEKYRLLSDNQVIRELVYALMDRALDSREFEFLLAETIKLDDAALNRFKSVLDKADLLDIITFSEEVAKKQQVLDFLQKLLYSEVAEEWERDGKPNGFFWQVGERALWSSHIAMKRLDLLWLVETPNWARQNPKCRRWLLQKRILASTTVLAVLALLARLLFGTVIR